jgi:methylated-DNA-[protein]-cysteine S-methyltransferase
MTMTSTQRAVDRFAERAAAEELIDVAYTEADSPFGPLLLAATPRGLVRLGLPNQDGDELLGELAEKVSPRVLEAPARLDQARRELDRYFEGELHQFDLPLDWSLSHGFRRRALEQIAAIPYGETSTYTLIAGGAGNPRAVRAAGSACATNPIPLVVPCHRVLRLSGGLGGYAGGLAMKEALLELEGGETDETAG